MLDLFKLILQNKMIFRMLLVWLVITQHVMLIFAIFYGCKSWMSRFAGLRHEV